MSTNPRPSSATYRPTPTSTTPTTTAGRWADATAPAPASDTLSFARRAGAQLSFDAGGSQRLRNLMDADNGAMVGRRD
ncbi:hypothetical protein [Halomarina ordinaria]|uniref:Uncharacterized protein n=1 Tax=Halomarina ordinaria TaxID=3033939 RepID=A0ABD5UAT2_9EURY|nr:hypothetical protein [Halomarina sp. PSRA2]